MSIVIYIIEMDFLQQKEEIESKINEINTYWKDLETTYQKELNKRYGEYQEDKPNKKAKLKICIIMSLNYY